jgi:nitrite reductase (NADH) small subunit
MSGIEARGRVWADICPIDSIPVRGCRRVRTQHTQLALFRTSDDEVFCLEDRCPHAGGPISQGIVHGKAVTCPLHNWVLSLETGSALGADKGQVRTFPVKLENGTVSIRVADLLTLSERAEIADQMSDKR